MIAIDDVPIFVRENTAVAVPIEGDPDVRAVRLHGLGKRGQMKRTTVLINIHAVRRDSSFHDVRAELLEDERRGLVGGAVRAVNRDIHAD